MQQRLLKPRKAINKAFLKIKPNRSEIERFKTNLIELLDRTNDTESEEFHKNLVSDFLKKTYYEPNHFINTKGRNDLVIHNGNKAKTSVGVIIEAKKPTNRAEMVTKEMLNVKAFHELVLYYLRERITHKNLEVRYLIITNIYEWFIFDAQLFDKQFSQNKNLIKQFVEFESGRLAGYTTDFFYKQIAEPFIKDLKQEIEFTYFDIRDYDSPLRNNNPKDDVQLIALFKLLSPEHLLKLPFINDSNSLDKSFYNELLYILGLTETKNEGKRVIERFPHKNRNSGSIIEDTIIQLDSLDKINRISKVFLFGENYEERLFNVALNLNITWINRILFLKLLEAQLVSYHKGDKSYLFLNRQKLKEYDDLNSLFFQVLAKDYKHRNEDVKSLFEKVPYLNSSLFEPTELEHQTLFISNLKDDKTIPVLSSTVLKDSNGKKRTGNLSTLTYLFEFLEAYDFGGEGKEEIQEENKTLINASVLGLIFEKINGYKDGSYFTPGMITMFMCKETIRRAVIHKFNETKGWNCESMTDLYNLIKDKKEANTIVNTIKICDPAVGSGHFLVSALNEIIAVKSDLNILQDKDGRLFKDYHIEVENDELIITDEEGKLFEYNPTNKESQRVQETLFHEKETVIENCLFGVDINPNSVKICRLRLWIELLKNAYYKTSTELETLPNIDINIKNGNSLISRFNLDSDLKIALKNSKISIDDYKNAVANYRNATGKEQKRQLESLIVSIKSNFRSEISKNSKEIKGLNLLKAEYYTKYETNQLFEINLTKAQLKDKKNLESKIKGIEDELEEIKNNKIYENAFEWRFEFPEVLDEKGDFIGFDAIIGNPPYIQLQKMGADSDALQKIGYETFARSGDIYSLFYELGYNLLKEKGVLTYITSNKWMRAAYGESLRKFFAEKTDPLILIDFGGAQIFDTATVDTNILMFAKDKNRQQTQACVVKDKALINLSDYFMQYANQLVFIKPDSWLVLSPIEQSIKAKIEAVGVPLKDWDININYGIKTGFNEAFIIDKIKHKELIEQDPKSDEILRPLLRGRDIKKYSYQFNDLYIITTFPSLKIDIDLYPAVKAHLLSFGYDRLSQSGAKDSRKRTNNKWFETQDTISYWEDFYKQKIAWGNLNLKASFTLADEGIFINAPSPILVPANKFLLAVLNSKLADYYIRSLGVTRNGGYFEYKPMFIEKLPVPIGTGEENLIENLVDKILFAQQKGNSFDDIEILINEKVYEIYGLVEEEIKFIQNLQT